MLLETLHSECLPFNGVVCAILFRTVEVKKKRTTCSLTNGLRAVQGLIA